MAPRTRTKRTLRRLSPLARELAEIQNDMLRLTKRVERLQRRVTETELEAVEAAGLRRILQPETETLLAQENAKRAAGVLRPRPLGEVLGWTK